MIRACLIALVLQTSSACLDSVPADAPSADGLADAPSADVPTGDARDVAPSDACATVAPLRLDFGARALGDVAVASVTYTNCGALTTNDIRVYLAPGASAAFAVDAVLPSLGQDPLRVAPGQSSTVRIAYTPTSLSARADDAWVVDAATLVFETDGGPVQQVPLMGFAPGIECPVAVIHVDEGGEARRPGGARLPTGPNVAPHTTVHLSGAASFGSYTEVASYDWHLVQPAGAEAELIISDDGALALATLEVVGVYRVRLDVFDANGSKSCSPAEVIVNVASPDALYMELSWDARTGNDDNDLDLHLRHPAAPDFFAVPWDAYFFNTDPSWGTPSPDDDPHLTSDGGLESLRLASPQPGLRYCVGVHAYSLALGHRAWATLRIYDRGTLRFSATLPLANGDLWDVGCLRWQNGLLVEAPELTGDPIVIHHFQVPDLP